MPLNVILLIGAVWVVENVCARSPSTRCIWQLMFGLFLSFVYFIIQWSTSILSFCLHVIIRLHKHYGFDLLTHFELLWNALIYLMEINVEFWPFNVFRLYFYFIFLHWRNDPKSNQSAVYHTIQQTDLLCQLFYFFFFCVHMCARARIISEQLCGIKEEINGKSRCNKEKLLMHAGIMNVTVAVFGWLNIGKQRQWYFSSS